MDIGKPEREIYIEPITVPEERPVERPEPVKQPEPVKEPVESK